MKIRRFEPADAAALAQLFHAAVHRLAVNDYSPAQISAWSPAPPDTRHYIRRSTDRSVLVAVADDGTVIGYGDLEADGHIDHLYCHPDWAGKGVGSAICAALEKAARTAGIGRLFVEASEGARRLFERQGFTVDARNTVQIGSVALHNYRMSKALA